MFIQKRAAADRLEALFRFTIAFAVLAWFGLVASIIYVAAHFIVKFW